MDHSDVLPQNAYIQIFCIQEIIVRIYFCMYVQINALDTELFILVFRWNFYSIHLHDIKYLL
jgi:hypothetical protein